MTYEAYRYIFIGAAILCLIAAVVAVVLFVVLNIPKVIGDLSGRTARKAIENIRNQNESSGEKTYRSSAVNQARGKLTDKISPSGRIIKVSTDGVGAAMATEKLNTQKLDANAGETMSLETERSLNDVEYIFDIEFDITYIHSDEIIDMEALL